MSESVLAELRNDKPSKDDFGTVTSISFNGKPDSQDIQFYMDRCGKVLRGEKPDMKDRDKDKMIKDLLKNKKIKGK